MQKRKVYFAIWTIEMASDERHARSADKQSWRAIAAEMSTSRSTIDRYRNGNNDATRKRRAKAALRT
jgi:hypothetical protein